MSRTAARARFTCACGEANELGGGSRRRIAFVEQIAGGCRHLKDKAAQVGVLGKIADVLLHIGGVDLDRLAGPVGRRKRDLVEHPLHHRLQTPRADVLDR